MDQLHDIRAFIEVARTGHFGRASEKLEQSSSAISKAITRLEKKLGVRLFERTTRHLALTDEGRTYYEDCDRILSELEQANDAVSRRKSTPHGSLRIHFPLLWAREVVVPALPKFQRQYPHVELKLVFSEARIDPVNDGFDLSVQVGVPDDSRLVAKVLRRTRSLIVASPAYLKRAGVPKKPDDLYQHECVNFIMADSLTPARWGFLRAGKFERRAFKSRLELSDPHSLVNAALAGAGLIQAPDLLLNDALARGRLRQVLKEWESEGPSICMVWPQNRYMSLRLRVFIDWIGGLEPLHRS